MNETLAEQQAAFARALFDAPRAADPFLVGDAATIEARLDVYRATITAGWARALAQRYPVVAALVGDDYLAALARAYGRAHPSTSGDLGRFGDAFPSFLATFPPVAELPYLPDVARVEQSVAAIRDAGAGVLRASDLARCTAEELDALRVALRYPEGLVSSDWAVVSLWRAHRTDDTAFPADAARAERGLIVRTSGQTDVLALCAASFAFLDAIAAGRPIGKALDAALAHDAAFPFADRLAAWLAADVFVAV